MGVVKSIIGSLIGAAVGVGLYYGIKQTTEQTYIWFPLVIGVLTGIAARLVAGTCCSNSGRFISGAFAGLIAGAAILGIDFAPTYFATPDEFGPIELKDRLNNESPAKQPANVEPPTDQAADDPNQMEIDREQRSDDVGDAANDTSKSDAADQIEPDGVSEQENDSARPESDTRSDDQTTDDVDQRTSSIPGDSTNPESRDQSRTPQNVPVNSDANNKRFEDLIRKQSHQSWYNYVMPHVFTGLGMLAAYQITRGFGAGKPKS